MRRSNSTIRQGIPGFQVVVTYYVLSRISWTNPHCEDLRRFRIDRFSSQEAAEVGIKSPVMTLKPGTHEKRLSNGSCSGEWNGFRMNSQHEIVIFFAD